RGRADLLRGEHLRVPDDRGDRAAGRPARPRRAGDPRHRPQRPRGPADDHRDDHRGGSALTGRRPHAALTAGAFLATAVALLPLAYLLLRTLQGGLPAWWEAVATERVAVLAGTSVLLATAVTGACLLIGVGGAWLVTRSDVPGRRLLAVLLALPLAVPSYVAAFTWVSVADLWAADPGTRFEGFTAAAVVLTLYTYPYVYLPVAAALVRVDPSQEEVARSLGHGPLQTLLTVTLPQVRPAIAGGGLLAALYVL